MDMTFDMLLLENTRDGPFVVIALISVEDASKLYGVGAGYTAHDAY